MLWIAYRSLSARRLVSTNFENASRIRAFCSGRVFGHDGKDTFLFACIVFTFRISDIVGFY